MPGIRSLISASSAAGSVVGGMLGSALLLSWLVSAGSTWNPYALLLGGGTGLLGWLLAGDLGDSVMMLIVTAFPGLVVLNSLNHDFLRILFIAVLCGFNIGQLVGGAFRESTLPSP